LQLQKNEKKLKKLRIFVFFAKTASKRHFWASSDGQKASIATRPNGPLPAFAGPERHFGRPLHSLLNGSQVKKTLSGHSENIR